MRESKIEKVKALVHSKGGWSSIFSRYSGLSFAIQKKESTGSSVSVPCPKTGNGKTKFRLFRDYQDTGGGYHNDVGALPDGIDLIAFMEGCDKTTAMDKIIDFCGGDYSKITTEYVQSVSNRPKGPDSDEVAKRVRKLEKVYSQSIAARDDKSQVVANYLKSRGLNTDPTNLPLALGFTNSLWMGDASGELKKWNGLLGMMTDENGQNETIHRIFLDNYGNKAPLNNSKMLMQPPRYIGGCAIKLDEPCSTGNGEYTYLGVCEGIETALAVREATGCPMWSCYSDALLEMVKIPDYVNTVFIFADKDLSGAGLEKAESLAKRFMREGREVVIYLPTDELVEGEKSVDWLDMYTRYGSSAFPFILPESLNVNFKEVA